MGWRNIQKHKEEIVPMLKNARTIILYDTETTGIGTDAKIIEFAAVKYLLRESGMREIDKLNLYINPEMPLPKKIIEITGITDKILEGARPESVEAEEIFNFMSGGDIWAAYNCKFDNRMLAQMSERTGIDYTEKYTIDVLEMARDFISKDEIESYKLSEVTKYLFPTKYFEFHDALSDTRAMALVFSELVKRYNNYEDAMCKKRQCHLEYASLFINPMQKSMQRINLQLSEGGYGDIYWDCVKKCWGAKKNKFAEELFHSIDLANIEEQVMKRYGWRYAATTMDELSYSWKAAKKEAKL